MSKKTKALNNISKALGGTEKKQQEDILNEIASNIGGGGSESSSIPMVNIENNFDDMSITCQQSFEELMAILNNKGVESCCCLIEMTASSSYSTTKRIELGDMYVEGDENPQIVVKYDVPRLSFGQRKFNGIIRTSYIIGKDSITMDGVQYDI